MCKMYNFLYKKNKVCKNKGDLYEYYNKFTVSVAVVRRVRQGQQAVADKWAHHRLCDTAVELLVQTLLQQRQHDNNHHDNDDKRLHEHFQHLERLRVLIK